MRFENTGIENVTIELPRLTDIMRSEGFILAGQWDYERITYDRKFEIKGDTFYLRVQGFAVEGVIEENAKDAVIKLLTPFVGKYYYPHGVEYGEDENFPKSLVDQCNRILAKVKEEIDAVVNA
ncbi:YugN family protein [Bacillus sp. JJ1521]|uniref:YugN family protein n=1 Tax=Bacillus sp. JJ1521 TaxID=3122957 RepID=UPI003000CFDA